MDLWRFLNFSKILGIVTVMLLGLPVMVAQAATQVWGDDEDTMHVFSVDDIQGGFNDDRFGTNRSVLCGHPDSDVSCPVDGVQPKEETKPYALTLYPIDSAFGFNVIDFVGATQKVLGDGYWGEGWANDYTPGSANVAGTDHLGQPVNELTATPPLTGGLMISSTPTVAFKTPARLGTWCAGLGGATVKCDSEHYTVMEHVLTCHETIPYLYADPDTGVQGNLGDGVDCSDAPLDDVLLKISGGVVGVERIVPAADGSPLNLEPNELTTRDEIGASTDYSMTKKDDGKPLYRWGNLMKRPTDVRVYASIPLPPEWSDGSGNVYPVTKAELKIRHWITNSPNDQVRAEDMENEGASGVMPEYTVVENGEGEEDDVWLAKNNCWESDGDEIVGGETVYKNGSSTYYDKEGDDPYAFSEDLVESFTNAWYTSIDREPFEWWYTDASGEYRSFASPQLAALDPDFENLTLQSGPRWRLKAPKYGQDNPGVEIGVDDTSEDPAGVPGCQEQPIQSTFKKYERGELTTTVLNLLDWDTVDGPAPLVTSAGWVDARENPNAIIGDGLGNEVEEETATGISVNGAPLTEDFDLVVYVKGDQKPTVIYDAELYIEWDDEAVAASWGEVAGVGDFDADGLSDTLIRSSGGSLSFLEADGTVNGIPFDATDWSVEGVGDFDNDGFADILVRNGKQVQYIEADGSPIVYKYNLLLDYEIQGVGDFDGNGTSDVLVLYTPRNTIWYLPKAGGTPVLLKKLDPAFSIVGVGEFLAADGTDKVLIRNNNAGGMFVLPAPRAAWQLYNALDLVESFEGVGDFNADGVSDVLVRNNTTSALSYIAAAEGALNPFGSPGASEQVEGVGLFNAGANADVLLQSGASLSFMQEGGATTAIDTSGL